MTAQWLIPLSSSHLHHDRRLERWDGFSQTRPVRASGYLPVAMQGLAQTLLPYPADKLGTTIGYKGSVDPVQSRSMSCSQNGIRRWLHGSKKLALPGQYRQPRDELPLALPGGQTHMQRHVARHCCEPCQFQHGGILPLQSEHHSPTRPVAEDVGLTPETGGVVLLGKVNPPGLTVVCGDGVQCHRTCIGEFQEESNVVGPASFGPGADGRTLPSPERLALNNGPVIDRFT